MEKQRNPLKTHEIHVIETDRILKKSRKSQKSDAFHTKSKNPTDFTSHKRPYHQDWGQIMPGAMLINAGDNAGDHTNGFERKPQISFHHPSKPESFSIAFQSFSIGFKAFSLIFEAFLLIFKVLASVFKAFSLAFKAFSLVFKDFSMGFHSFFIDFQSFFIGFQSFPHGFQSFFIGFRSFFNGFHNFFNGLQSFFI